MVRLRTVALVGSLGAVATLSVAAAAPTAQTPTVHQYAAAPNLSEGRLLHIALTAARASGDPHPTLVQHSAGTRAKANLLSAGAAQGGNARSYLIAERGHFVLNNVPRPSGAPAPHGSVLTMVVDAATGQITDFGTSDRYPRLAALGPVTTDLAASVHATCSKRAPAPVNSLRPGAGHVLVPAGARTLLLCRYRGTPGLMPGRLAQQRLISGQRTVSKLATDLDAVPKTPAYPCPNGNGSVIVAYFRYRTSPDDPVQIEATGCQIVSNGQIARFAGLTARGRHFLAELARALDG